MPISDYLTLDGAIKAVRHPSLAFSKLYQEIWGDINFDEVIFESRSDYRAFLNEVAGSSFEDSLNTKVAQVDALTGTTARGDTYVAGSIKNVEARRLYSIVRHLKPEIVVETGVCNGYSTAFILKALQENRAGKLYSIDYPEFTGEENSGVWDGKGGAIIPADKDPGWIVPSSLQNRWELILGKSQDELGSLCQTLSKIDVFLHDSEHSYETMTFEYETVWPLIPAGGLLLTHDAYSNEAFTDFSSNHGGKVIHIDENFAGVVKK